MSGDIDTDELRRLDDALGHCDEYAELVHAAADEIDRLRAALSASPAGEREPEDIYEQAWNEAHADLLVLNEPDRVKARELVADFAGGDFNAADGLIGLLHRNGFEVVNSATVVATPDAALSLGLVAAGERDTTEAGEAIKHLRAVLESIGDVAEEMAWEDARAFLAARPAPVTGQGETDERPHTDGLDCWCVPAEVAARFAGLGEEPTSRTDDFGRVLIPADADRRRRLGEAAGLTPEEQAALDAFAFREAEKRRRGVLTTAEAEGFVPAPAAPEPDETKP